MQYLNLHKNIPVKYEVDIFIAGGGPSGIAAAITAARQRACVFLAESHTCFGGMSTAGMVPLFMQFGDGRNFLAAGFGQEVYQRVLQSGGKPSGEYLTIPTEALKRIYDQMAVNAKFDFCFQTTLIDVISQDSMIKYAVCHAKSGIFAVKAKQYIDCTGDGDLSVKAGAKFEKGSSNGKLMPGTLCSLWANVNWENVEPPEKQNIVPLLEKAFKDKIFTVEDRHHSGMAQTGKTLANANIGHTFNLDGTDEQSVTKALITARQYLPEYERFYTQYINGYQNAELAVSGSLLGVRETRRIIGDYVLNSNDFKNHRQFDDQIGCYCYELDIHPSNPTKQAFENSIAEYKSSKYKPGEYYGIPYRCLKPKGLSNLLVAGRCISTDRAMQSSIRTMPGCFITGQAAGMAAAICTESNCDTQNLDIVKLQERLKSIGAFIGKENHV